ncbi:hypothetical protein DPMN_000709 [Dreissena polymorpha]|uniref:Uncharacterized protein n=1 Tax=Dreissena polymorpha TaxID=45954 RepID=A0A9D4MH69_DREPO|nr:hypothetical protein DPMN_000709 [Dreissena polymorpha]
MKGSWILNCCEPSIPGPMKKGLRCLQTVKRNLQRSRILMRNQLRSRKMRKRRWGMMILRWALKH